MEVNEILGVGLQTLKIEDGDVLLQQSTRDLLLRFVISCLDSIESRRIGSRASHELERKGRWQSPELITKQRNDPLSEISSVSL